MPVCCGVIVQVMLLRKLGYEIIVAVNGVEALSTLEREARRGPQHEIEVVLMVRQTNTHRR